MILTAFVSYLYFQMKGKAPYLIIFYVLLCTKQQIWTVGVVTAVLLWSYTLLPFWNSKHQKKPVSCFDILKHLY